MCLTSREGTADFLPLRLSNAGWCDLSWTLGTRAPNGPRALLRWGRSWTGIARKIAHRPTHHFLPHPLDVGPLPDLLAMTQAIVEDTPFAVLASPDDREVLVLAADTFVGQVDLVGVQTQQHANVFAREVLDLVDLVMESEVALQVL